MLSAIVVPRRHAADLVDWIAAELPKYNMRTSEGKLYAYLPGPPHAQYSEALAERGFSVSRQGLQRLLGAPIGTTEFMCRPAADGGHLARLTGLCFVLPAPPLVRGRDHIGPTIRLRAFRLFGSELKFKKMLRTATQHRHEALTVGSTRGNSHFWTCQDCSSLLEGPSKRIRWASKKGSRWK